MASNLINNLRTYWKITSLNVALLALNVVLLANLSVIVLRLSYVTRFKI